MDCQKKELVLENVEGYFFRFAFPCAQVKVRKGTLTVEEYNKLKEQFLNNNPPNKEELEKTFPPAFTRIKRLASRMQKDFWDLEVIKEYWEKEHNILINTNDGMYSEASETLKELCKIHEAEVIEINPNYLKVKYSDKTRNVLNPHLLNINLGDKIRIHYAWAVEKV